MILAPLGIALIVGALLLRRFYRAVYGERVDPDALSLINRYDEGLVRMVYPMFLYAIGPAFVVLGLLDLAGVFGWSGLDLPCMRRNPTRSTTL